MNQNYSRSLWLMLMVILSCNSSVSNNYELKLYLNDENGLYPIVFEFNKEEIIKSKIDSLLFECHNRKKVELLKWYLHYYRIGNASIVLYETNAIKDSLVIPINRDSNYFSSVIISDRKDTVFRVRFLEVPR